MCVRACVRSSDSLLFVPLPQKAEAEAKKAAKKAKEAAAAEMMELMASVIVQPKVPPGTDPKSVLCEFFKHGKCRKGANCRFSHDLNVNRRTAKAAIYADEEEKKEGMDDWDQATLEDAVAKKHGAEAGRANKTKIICKFFLEAIEKRQYGWFWKCPNGPDCIYQHKLPPGYVLKSEMKAMLEEERLNRPDVTETMEEERAKISSTVRINDATFKEWHAKKWELKRKRWEEAKEERRKKGLLTGREIYETEGFMVEDDANANDDDDDVAAERRKQYEAEEAEMKAAAEKAWNDAKVAGGGDWAGEDDENHDEQTGIDLEELEELELDDEDLDALEAEIAAAETS